MNFSRPLALGFAFAIIGSPAFAAPVKDAPKFDTIYNLVRSNLTGVSEAELNRAATDGFIHELKGRVSLSGEKKSVGKKSGAAAGLLGKPAIYENVFSYLRVLRVADGLAEKLAGTVEEQRAAGKVKGLVIDLRYTTGTDYAAATKVADLFLATEKPLLDWGQGIVRSKAKDEPLKLPVMVLINPQTRGAAEALAAIVREASIGLLIGNATAGEASVFKDFPLEDGRKLRIASGLVKLGSGEALSTQGVAPDISVAVSAEDEKAYFADAFKVRGETLAATNTIASTTNRPPRVRMTEAQLVKLQREGKSEDDEVVTNITTTAKSETGKPQLQDPVLGRALDLLKGLAIVQPPKAF